MTRREKSFVAVAIFVFVSGALGDEPGCPKKTTCAMTNVLVDMNKLLRILTSEIQDLRIQVLQSCQAKEKPTWDYIEEEPISEDMADEMLEKVNNTLSTEVDTDYQDTDNGTEIDDYEEEEDEGEEDEDEEDTGEGLFGNGTYVTSIIDSFTLFEPLPHNETVPESNSPNTTTAEPTTTTTTSAPPPITTSTSTTTTRATTTTLPPTTTKEPDLSIPPVPTTCPPSFTLIAKGCYMIVSDASHWSSWGRAHAFCQQYNGGLAQPYRFGALQKYLSRHYSDTFWVGAHRPGMKFLWLNNRKVGRKVWKQGQPSKHPKKNCVYLDRWSGYQASSHFCGEKYPFICEATEVQL